VNPLIEEILARQLRSLRRIHAVILVLVLVMCAGAILIESPSLGFASPVTLTWLEVVLALLGIALVAIIIPLSRRRLLNPDMVRRAKSDTLQAWGVPQEIDPTIGRQAIFLTRYTAGCVITWGLGASVGLYGLIARLIGSSAAVTAGFLALAIFVLVLLPPRADRAREALNGL